MAFQRRPDWMTRLQECVDNARLLPFVYGVHDCCLWAAHCVDAMCDTHLAVDVLDRLNYHDKESADAAIAAAGSLHELVSEFMGAPISAKFAAPGDMVVARDPAGLPIVAIVVGHTLVAPGEGGISVLPYSSAVLCWKV